MNQIPDLVMLACQDLLTSVMQVNNETTHMAFFGFTGNDNQIEVTVLKDKWGLSDRIYNEELVIETAEGSDEGRILRSIERIKSDLQRIISNDYANQHSLEPKREVRHA